MSLHDTDALVIETGTAAESLPDPTTVPGRTHVLSNTGNALTAVWSSVGATPFTENATNVATISVAAGQAKRVQSNGTRWAVIQSGSGPQHYSTTGVTAAGGILTVTFPTPFAAPPVVTAIALTAANDLTDIHLHSVTTTQAVLHVRQAPSVTILGISVVTFPSNAVGVTIHVEVIQAGAFQ